MVKQEDRRATTRTAILKAALDSFGRQGYAAVTVDQVAAQAGVAKGAVYHHFSSKDVLFETVLESVSSAIMEEVVSATATATDFWTAASAGNRAFFAACADPRRAQILLHDGPAVLGWDRWRKIDQRNFGGLMIMAVTAAMEQGIIFKADPEIVVRTLLGAVTEAAISAAESNDFMACAEQYLDVIDAMVAGLAIPRHRRGK